MKAKFRIFTGFQLFLSKHSFVFYTKLLIFFHSCRAWPQQWRNCQGRSIDRKHSLSCGNCYHVLHWNLGLTKFEVHLSWRYFLATLILFYGDLCRFAVLSDMIQRCPYTPVTALLLHQLKEEMISSWPFANSDSSIVFAEKGPFVTFGVSLVLDSVTVHHNSSPIM